MSIEPTVKRGKRILSQQDLEQEMLDVSDALEASVEAYREYGEALAKAEVAYKVEHAKAYLRASGTVPEREATADYLTADVAQTFKLAEAVVKYTREALNAKHARLEVLRGLNANLRPMVSSR